MYSTLSIALLKDYLKIGTELIEDNELLEACLERAQSHLENETRRVFEAASATRYYHATRDVDDDGDCLYLDEDLYSLTTATNGDGEDVTDDCVLIPTNWRPAYALELKSETWVYDDTPHEAISIEGLWGYSEEPPNDVIQAIIRLAAFLYKQKDSAAVDTASYYEGGILTIPQGIPQYTSLVIGRYAKRAIG